MTRRSGSTLMELIRCSWWLGLLLVCSGGCAEPVAEVDASMDVGPDVRLSANPVSSCDGIFEEAEGTPCEPSVECVERRLVCTRRHADCSRGIIEYDDVDVWSAPEIDCAFGASSIVVDMESEVFELDASVGSFAHEFSQDARLDFYNGDLADCPERRLRLDLLFPPDFLTYTGTYASAGATLVLGDGVSVRVEGSVEISSDERPDGYWIELEGSLALEGDGVSITGSFRVIECAALRRNNL